MSMSNLILAILAAISVFGSFTLYVVLIGSILNVVRTEEKEYISILGVGIMIFGIISSMITVVFTVVSVLDKIL